MSVTIAEQPSTTASPALTTAPPPIANPIAQSASLHIILSYLKGSTFAVSVRLTDAPNANRTKTRLSSAHNANEARLYSTAHVTLALKVLNLV